ncbi:MAG: DUF1428 domain-containing protein [Pseudomonadota bacterium]
MPYIDGFVAAVPSDKKDEYIAFAKKSWPIFEGLGAIAMWECWGDEVPDGEVTSFPMAVQAREDETVLFSWTAWPDKAARDQGWEKMMSDPEIGAAMGDMPMDGKRMIYGGFTPLLSFGEMRNI